MSRICINLFGPYKYVKITPSSLPLPGRIISYTNPELDVWYIRIPNYIYSDQFNDYYFKCCVPGALGDATNVSNGVFFSHPNNSALGLMNLLLSLMQVHVYLSATGMIMVTFH